MRGLIYVNIIGSSICNLLLLRYFVVRIIAKKKLFFLSTDPKSVFPLFFLLHGIGDFIFSVLKIASPVRPVVGRDVSITLMAVFLPVLCFCGLVLYYSVIINFLKGYSRIMRKESRDKVDQKFAILLKRSYWLPPLSMLPCLLPLIGLGLPEYTTQFGMTYLIANGVLALLYGALFNFALGFLLQELDINLKERESDIGSDDLRLVYSRLKAAYFAGSGSFVMIGFSYLIFGSFQVLLRKSSYLILIIQITTHPVFTVLILTVSHISHAPVFPLKVRSNVEEFLNFNKSNTVEGEMKADVHPRRGSQAGSQLGTARGMGQVSTLDSKPGSNVESIAGPRVAVSEA